MLYQVGPQVPQIWWLLLAPWIQNHRAKFGDPRLYENLEWLAEVMAEMDRRAGAPAITQDRIPSFIDGQMAYSQEAINVARAMRTLTLASPEAAPVAQPTKAAPLA